MKRTLAITQAMKCNDVVDVRQTFISPLRAAHKLNLMHCPNFDALSLSSKLTRPVRAIVLLSFGNAVTPGFHEEPHHAQSVSWSAAGETCGM